MPKKLYRSLYFKLVIVFFLILCLLYGTVRSVFSWAMTTSQGDLQRRSEEHLDNYSNRLINDHLLLDQLQPNWLFDRNALKLIQPERGSTPTDHYNLYMQLKSRLGLLLLNTDISAIYMYFPNTQYLLSVLSENDYAAEQPLSAALMDFRPSEHHKLIYVDDQLYLVNAYTPSTQTFQDSYTFLIAFALDLDKAFSACDSNDCIVLADEDKRLIYATGHNADKLSLLFPFEKSSITLDGEYYSVINRTLLNGQLHIYCLGSDAMKELKTTNTILTLSLLASCLVVGILFWLSINAYIRKPLNVIADAFRKVERHEEWPTIELHSSRDMEEIAERFNAMVLAQQTLTTHKENAELLMKQSELRLLQSQINPHFLYNCFFMMSSMIELENYDELSMMTDNLGKYFKYIFVNAEGIKTLEEEVEHARAYANIQLMRFIDRIEVEIPLIPESWRKERIPAVVLQPLVENAFLHGFGKTSQYGRLWIDFVADAADRKLRIEVSNDSVSMPDEELEKLAQGIRDKSIKSALANIQQRLCLMYDEGLTFSNLGGTGFSVTFTITRKEGGKDAL